MDDRDDIDASAAITALFSVITGVIKEAHPIATQGQNAKIEPTKQRELTMELRAMLDHAKILAGAVELLLR